MPILWRICIDVDGGILSIPEPSLHLERPVTIAEAARKYLVLLYISACKPQSTAAVRNRFIE